MLEKTLLTMFHDGVRDIYYVERKIVKALPKMARAASSQELKEAFKTHQTETATVARGPGVGDRTVEA